MPSLSERLGLTRPLVLAPMAGGVSTPALVAAVSEVGALGSYGAAYLSPAQLRQVGAEIRVLTARPFALNLFAPQEMRAVQPEEVRAAQAELAPFHAELGLGKATLPAQVQEDFGAQFEAALEVAPAVLSFAFGRLGRAELAELRRCGILSIGTATGVEEARELAADGVDALVLQGGAAGGHRGGWARDELADTLTLTRAVCRAVPLPVIAAGGLMTREDVRAALAAGASLAQCGTAFLLADEAGTSSPYRAALQAGGETVLTRAFSGRLARGLANRMTREVARPLPYPQQNALTRPLRTAAAQAKRADFLSLWAGTGFAQARALSAAQIVEALTP